MCDSHINSRLLPETLQKYIFSRNFTNLKFKNNNNNKSVIAEGRFQKLQEIYQSVNTLGIHCVHYNN